MWRKLHRIDGWWWEHKVKPKSAGRLHFTNLVFPWSPSFYMQVRLPSIHLFSSSYPPPLIGYQIRRHSSLNYSASSSSSIGTERHDASDSQALHHIRCSSFPISRYVGVMNQTAPSPWNCSIASNTIDRRQRAYAPEMPYLGLQPRPVQGTHQVLPDGWWRRVGPRCPDLYGHWAEVKAGQQTDSSRVFPLLPPRLLTFAASSSQ